MQRIGPVLLGVSLMSTGGCFPDIEYEGKYVHLGTDSHVPPCEGTVDYLDLYVEALADYLGIEPFIIEVYWLIFGLHRCPETAEGCAAEGIVVTAWLPPEHELAHALFAYQSNSFFDEGTATALGGYNPTDAPPVPTSRVHDPRDVLTIDQLPGEYYETAGSFVLFLIEKYGVETYMSLYEQIDSESTYEDIDRAMQGVLGAGLNPLVESYLAADQQCFSQIAYCSSAHPQGEWLDEYRWSYRGDVGCGAETSVGPAPVISSRYWATPTENRSLSFVEFDIAEPGMYRVFRPSAEGEEGMVHAYLNLCTRCRDRWHEPVTFAQSREFASAYPVYLQQGHYSVRIETIYESAVPVVLEIERIPEIDSSG